eukprot:TRINITY_DN13066_c0_g1_i2.p1 TRINITY_DN13066_c0_g1~~TRINITY_DN13066_c0_g1_i2.p1  ORF type:complete len:150 (-),score=22.29 TRINITY_DN13066_c0_g1_i2:55-459(-)
MCIRDSLSTFSCLIAIILGLRYAYSGQVPYYLLAYLKLYMRIYPTMLYIQSFEVTLGMFNCASINGKSYLSITTSYNSPVRCLGSFHIALVCMAAVFLILHIALVLPFIILDLEVQMKTKNCTCLLYTSPSPRD